MAICPVTVSASTRRTRWPRRTWSVVARLIEMVVLPTPPFGLKTQTTVARFVQAAESRPLSDSMIGPLPSSTVCARMSIASTRQRSESALYGRVKYSSLIVAFVAAALSCSRFRGETTISAGMSRPLSWSSE